MVIRARSGLLWWVLSALLLAQTLGLVHRIAHGSQLVVLPGTQVAAQDDGNWANGLASGHADDASCLVFDQVSQGGAVFALPAIALPAAAPLFFLRWFQGEALARWAALFEARGPPTLR